MFVNLPRLSHLPRLAFKTLKHSHALPCTPLDPENRPKDPRSQSHHQREKGEPTVPLWCFFILAVKMRDILRLGGGGIQHWWMSLTEGKSRTRCTILVLYMSFFPSCNWVNRSSCDWSCGIFQYYNYLASACPAKRVYILHVGLFELNNSLPPTDLLINWCTLICYNYLYVASVRRFSQHLYPTRLSFSISYYTLLKRVKRVWE